MSDPEYLVHFGLGAFLGRFRAPAADAFDRDCRVVVQTARGLELGVVRDPVRPRLASAVGPGVSGDIVRATTPADDATADTCRARAEHLLADAQAVAESMGLPLTLLDAEVLFDGATGVLQALHWADCDATPLFAELSRRHGLTATLHDLTAPAVVESSGCGDCGSSKGGCSSCGTGGGCSTGSCSSGQVKSAAELTDYFSGLRKQMEATTGRYPIHAG